MPRRDACVSSRHSIGNTMSDNNIAYSEAIKVLWNEHFYSKHQQPRPITDDDAWQTDTHSENLMHFLTNKIVIHCRCWSHIINRHPQYDGVSYIQQDVRYRGQIDTEWIGPTVGRSHIPHQRIHWWIVPAFQGQIILDGHWQTHINVNSERKSLNVLVTLWFLLLWRDETETHPKQTSAISPFTISSSKQYWPKTWLFNKLTQIRHCP